MKTLDELDALYEKANSAKVWEAVDAYNAFIALALSAWPEVRGRLRRAEAVPAGKVLLLVDMTEACVVCGETFTEAEQRAFDPECNDHCPRCDRKWCLTTYYGDPADCLRESDLGATEIARGPSLRAALTEEPRQ